MVVLLQLNSEQYTAMSRYVKVQSIHPDITVRHQLAAAPNSDPAASTPSATTSTAASIAAVTRPVPAGPTESPAASDISNEPASDIVAAAAAPSSVIGSAAFSGNDSISPGAKFTTQAPATWGLDRVDQAGLPLNGTYRYTNDGTGVHVYMFDTVSTLHALLLSRMINSVETLQAPLL